MLTNNTKILDIYARSINFVNRLKSAVSDRHFGLYKESEISMKDVGELMDQLLVLSDKTNVGVMEIEGNYCNPIGARTPQGAVQLLEEHVQDNHGFSKIVRKDLVMFNTKQKEVYYACSMVLPNNKSKVLTFSYFV